MMSQEPIVTQDSIKKVVSFKGQQVTGISVSENGRIFANFPRWRENVKKSVVEVNSNGKVDAFPNEEWNSWSIGDQPSDSVFVGVQSVLTSQDELFVLDTRNALFKGVIDKPRIFVFDLDTRALKRIFKLDENSFHKDSYINDLRVDRVHNHIYLTDSNHAGLMIINMETGANRRVLDNHSSTLAETNELTINGKKYENTINSDGIALDTKNDLLYYHALTGYTLYSVSAKSLREDSEEKIESAIQEVGKTTAPDGMVLDNDMIYMADLENNAIMRFDTTSKNMKVLAKGEKIRWADTFSLYNGELYYTNSRIHEVSGSIDDMYFDIYKIMID